MIKQLSKKTNGNDRLSANFKVSEFACNDGSDTILIDTELVDVLQTMRDHFKKPINLTSGYRTPTYDKKVGGSGSGMHTKGKAADIYINGVEPAVIAYYAQRLMPKSGGVECGCYESGGYVHIDVRSSKWRAIKAYSNRGYKTVNNLFPTVKNGTTSQCTVMLQRKLNSLGYNCGTVDGICGKKTVAAIKKYQTDKKLIVDGICGAMTFKTLYGSDTDVK